MGKLKRNLYSTAFHFTNNDWSEEFFCRILAKSKQIPATLNGTIAKANKRRISSVMPNENESLVRCCPNCIHFHSTEPFLLNAARIRWKKDKQIVQEITHRKWKSFISVVSKKNISNFNCLRCIFHRHSKINAWNDRCPGIGRVSSLPFTKYLDDAKKSNKFITLCYACVVHADEYIQRKAKKTEQNRYNFNCVLLIFLGVKHC